MKESHQSVSHSFIHKYRDANDDKAMLCNSTFRSWRKKFTILRNEIRNSAYPAHVESLWILIALVIGLHFTDKTPRYGLMKWITGFSIVAE